MPYVVIDNLCYAAAHPADGVSEANPLWRIHNIVSQHVEIYLPYHNEIQDHDDHGPG